MLVQRKEMSVETALSGNFLQTFWDLASEEEAERIRAASCLVTYLTEQQVWAQIGMYGGLSKLMCYSRATRRKGRAMS